MPPRQTSPLCRSYPFTLTLVLLAVVAASAARVTAVPIIFDLRDTGATAEILSGKISRDGVIATLAPVVTISSGVLNQTASGFGINASGSGDDTDALDGVAGAEAVSLSFDTDVLFTDLALSLFSAGEQARLTIAGFSTLTLNDTGAGSDVYTFATNNLVLAGQTVLFEWLSGNGFSFDNFTIETVSASVPDAATTASLLGIALLGFVFFRPSVRRPCPVASR